MSLSCLFCLCGGKWVHHLERPISTAPAVWSQPSESKKTELACVFHSFHAASSVLRFVQAKEVSWFICWSACLFLVMLVGPAALVPSLSSFYLGISISLTQ
jgi:hypothetical protein